MHQLKPMTSFKNIKKSTWILLTFFQLFAYSQQESKIRIDSANKNDITVMQSGIDSLQKSDIDIQNSDSNKLELNQSQRTITKKSKESNSFMRFISNTNAIVALLSSIIILIALFRKHIPFFKKKFAKK